MPYIVGRGRYARETYPEPRGPGGGAVGPTGPGGPTGPCCEGPTGPGGPGSTGPTGPAGPVFVGGTAQVTVDFNNSFDTNGNGNQWRAAVGGDFSYAGTPDFTLTAASCVLTYNGTSGRSFLVLLSVAWESSGGVAGTSGIAIALNNDLVGGAMFSNAASAAGAGYDELVTDGAAGTAVQRRVTLNNGDTLRPVGAKFVGNADLLLHSVSLSVVPQ